MGEKDKSLISIFLGEAIIIAFISALGYMVTFIYEKSYIDYFGLRLEENFISPSIYQIILTSVIVFLAVIICLKLPRAIYRTIRPGTESRKNILFHLLSALIAYFVPFSLFSIFLLGFSLSVMVKLAIVFLGMIIIFILLQPLVHWIAKKNEYQEAEETILDDLFFSTHLDYLFGKNTKTNGMPLVFVLGLLLVTIITPDIAISRARQKITYNVISTKPELAVLTQYQNIMVAVPFDKESKKIIPQIHLVDIDTLESSSLFLSPEKIGPLQPFTQEKSLWDKIADWIVFFCKKVIEK